MLSVKPRQACQASKFKMLETNLSQLFAYKPVNPSAMRTGYMYRGNTQHASSVLSASNS